MGFLRCVVARCPAECSGVCINVAPAGLSADEYVTTSASLSIATTVKTNVAASATDLLPIAVIVGALSVFVTVIGIASVVVCPLAVASNVTVYGLPAAA